MSLSLLFIVTLLGLVVPSLGQDPPTVTATTPSSAAVGTSVTITCSIDANPAVTSIIWQYITINNSNNIDIINNNRYSGGTLSTPSLTISPVQENDEGSYRCLATNTEGTGVSNLVFLDTTGDPPVNVAVTPNPITVQQGQTITATCSSSANPPASYEWRVFGTTTVIQTGPTLTISNADTTNANRYVCRAYNSFGSGEASTNVDVQLPPGPAQITAPSLIVEGQSVTMTCSSTGGSPAPTIRWFKGDTEITTGVTTQTLGNTVTATLVFTASKYDHYAVIECQVDNGVLQNPLKDTEFVFVNYTPDPPTLTGPTTLTAGDPGVWTCFSNDGYPAGIMTMKNQNTQFPGSQFTSASTADGFGFDVTGTLNWTPALANNGHTICCNVAHDTTLGAGNPQEVCLTLTINAPLAVNAPVTSYTPTIGNSVTLQCVVTSGTATSITWLKEGQALTISSNNRLSGGSPTTPSLNINNVQSSDGGNYVCRAANAVSTVNTNTINLDPQETATTETPTNYVNSSCDKTIEIVVSGLVGIILGFVILIVFTYIRGKVSGQHGKPENGNNHYTSADRNYTDYNVYDLPTRPTYLTVTT